MARFGNRESSNVVDVRGRGYDLSQPDDFIERLLQFYGLGSGKVSRAPQHPEILGDIVGRSIPRLEGASQSPPLEELINQMRYKNDQATTESSEYALGRDRTRPWAMIPGLIPKAYTGK